MITPRLVTLQDMFADRVQYQVPIYQRPYAWGRDDQWQPLWGDIAETASRRAAGDARGSQAHFLGSIVIELTAAEAGRVRTYAVIDGQQRLTTLQLILAGLRTVVKSRDTTQLSDIDRLLLNEGRHAGGALKYKLALGRHDQDVFAAIIDGAREPAEDGLMGAVKFFTEAIGAWVGDDSESDLRLDALQDALDG